MRERAPHPFGLRDNLLFRDSLVYYLVIFLNLFLRFTWSLKLSTHLDTVEELESSVFLMEALEITRRWVWVFFRVEWEVVKKGSLLGADTIIMSEAEMSERDVPNGNLAPPSSAYRD